MYLSPSQDIFVKGPYWEECKYEDLRSSDRLQSDCDLVCNYDTEPMSSRECNRVKRVLDIDSDDPRFPAGGPYWAVSGEAPKYVSYQGKKAELFSKATTCFYINLYRISRIAPLEYPDPEITVARIMEVGGEGIFGLPWVQKYLAGISG
ncbi:hypothetical protein F5Y05DRAFT_329968 [Hypoxylon sp. FL0543]|nr:hypothetical protein F5Y05DRAFT_329968 [Hypoxylon sp. FL0543]